MVGRLILVFLLQLQHAAKLQSQTTKIPKADVKMHPPFLDIYSNSYFLLPTISGIASYLCELWGNFCGFACFELVDDGTFFCLQLLITLNSGVKKEQLHAFIFPQSVLV